MMQCPQCQRMVNAEGRTTCPACFAVLPAPPAATLSPGWGGVGSPGAPSPYGRTAVLAAPPLPSSPAPVYTPPPGSPYAKPAPPSVPSVPPIPPSAMYPSQGMASTTPLPQAGGLAGTPPGGRVTLTGEVIPETRAQTNPYPAPAPNPLPGAYSGGAYPSAPPVSAPLPPGYQAGIRRNGSKGVPVIAIVAVSAIAAVIGTQSVRHGGWGGRNMTPPDIAAAQSDPKSVADMVYHAFIARDWRRVFYASTFAVWDSKTEADAASFAQGVERGMDQHRATAEQVLAVLQTTVGITMGTPSIHGDTADVPTSGMLNVEGEQIQMHGNAHLLRRNGKWLWDLTGDQATALASLFGTPTRMGGGAPRFSMPNFTPFGTAAPTPGGTNTPGMSPPSMSPTPNFPHYTPHTPPNFGSPAMPPPSLPNLPHYTPPSGFGPRDPYGSRPGFGAGGFPNGGMPHGGFPSGGNRLGMPNNAGGTPAMPPAAPSGSPTNNGGANAAQDGAPDGSNANPPSGI